MLSQSTKKNKNKIKCQCEKEFHCHLFFSKCSLTPLFSFTSVTWTDHRRQQCMINCCVKTKIPHFLSGLSLLEWKSVCFLFHTSLHGCLSLQMSTLKVGLWSDFITDTPQRTHTHPSFLWWMQHSHDPRSDSNHRCRSFNIHLHPCCHSYSWAQQLQSLTHTVTRTDTRN